MRRLDERHRAFLLSPQTLERWAGKTLKERTVLFHRIYTDKRIAVTTLRRLYLRHGVRRKKVRQEKVLPGSMRAEFQQRCRTLLDKLAEVKARGLRLVWLDEVSFTKRSINMREWSGRNSNLTIDQQ